MLEIFSKKNNTNGKHLAFKTPTVATTTTTTGVAQIGDIKAEWKEITPAIAQSILDQQNAQNRKLRKGRAQKLTRAMERGVFRLTHQTIALDRNGVLIDGQHRLNAIVSSGKTITLLVVSGLDPIVRASTDIGDARTPADMLQIVGGEDRPALVAKALGAIRRSVFKTTQKADWDELDEMRQFFAPGLEWAAATMSSRSKSTSAPVVGALVFAYRRHPDIVADVYKELETGVIPSNDGVRSFRDLLLSTDLSGEKKSGQMFGKLITALWHRAHGRKVTRLYDTAEALTYFEKAYNS